MKTRTISYPEQVRPGVVKLDKSVAIVDEDGNLHYGIDVADYLEKAKSLFDFVNAGIASGEIETYPQRITITLPVYSPKGKPSKRARMKLRNRRKTRK